MAVRAVTSSTLSLRFTTSTGGWFTSRPLARDQTQVIADLNTLRGSMNNMGAGAGGVPSSSPTAPQNNNVMAPPIIVNPNV